MNKTAAGGRWRVAMALSLGLGGCSGASSRRPLGATCAAAADCVSGLCADGTCLAPDGDEDLDGLSNGLELSLGTDLFAADSDGDGRGDKDELDPDLAARDSDGDGVQDALESGLGDADHDCIPDESDVADADPDGTTSALLATLCPVGIGVCGNDEATLRVLCPDGLDAPVCDFAEVADHEPSETSCDGADNDCDGLVDEGCDPLSQGLVGHWKLDADGQDASINQDHGVVSGALATSDRFGHPGQALRFVAGAEVVVAATAHPQGAADTTYALWVRPEGGPSGDLGVLVFGDPGAGHRSLALTTARHCVATGTGHADSACAPSGMWTQLVIVRTNGAASIYLDGRLQATDEATDALTSTRLVIGAAPAPSMTGDIASFSGAIDDVRVWDRALSADEIQTLFGEGGWQPVGSADHPAQSCLHLRDAGGDDDQGRRPASGSYVIDVDGDGASAPFEAYCEMTLDGGGWTLAWVYGFTDVAHFEAVTNAVTPIPGWPASAATVPVSTRAPASPEAPGAIDWALWDGLGPSFAIVSDLNDGIACDPGSGSLSAAIDGSIVCRTVVDTTGVCQGTVPTSLAFSDVGPVLRADAHYYYFDGSETENWPTHDPCGLNSPQYVADPARWGGAVYLRATLTP